MSDTSLSLVLHNVREAKPLLTDVWTWTKNQLLRGRKVHMSARAGTRSLDQNALLWSCFTDLSRQVLWPVDGEMQRLSPDDWKQVLSAGLKRTQRAAKGVEGGFVMLGASTSRMTVAEMADLITLAHAFGDQNGVKWSRTSLGRDWPDEVAA